MKTLYEEIRSLYRIEGPIDSEHRIPILFDLLARIEALESSNSK